MSTEEIEALLKLFESISEDAILAFVIYLSHNFAVNLIWPLVFALFGVLAYKTLPKLISGVEDIDSINRYTTHSGTKYIGTSSAFDNLLDTLANGTGHVYTNDVQEAEKLYKERNK